MKRLVSGVLTVAAVFVCGAFETDANARSRYYDMSELLDQPHPFANQAPAPAPVRQRSRPPIPAIQAQPQAPAYTPPVRREPRQPAGRPDAGNPGWEIRLGALIHDEGPFSRNEEDGFDGNFEILFPSPKLLKIIGSPRPHIGGTINSDGNTNQGYFGLTWEWEFWRSWFAGFSLGGSVHDGKTETTEIDRKELGCHLLFRESVEFGYRLAGKHGISVFLDHISNANICDHNEGLENFGLRYGYRF